MKEYIKLQGVILNNYRYNISYHKKDLIHDYEYYNLTRQMNKQEKISLKDFVSMKILNSCIDYINNKV